MKVHPVVLAGAGPGDPGLLTVAARDAIREADVLVVDRLVSREVIDERRPDAKLVYVGKASGRHAVPQEMIQDLLVAQARAGRRVVRLKGGDPFVFGRGGEEAIALRAAGVPFRVVPGVTSAVAVPAYAGVPLTHRGVSRRFTVLAGSSAELATVPEEGWRAVAEGSETLVVLMGLANLPRIVELLRLHGVVDDLPACAVSQGTTTAQRVVEAPVGELAAAVAAAGLETPTIVVIGRVVSLRKEVSWFEAISGSGGPLGKGADVATPAGVRSAAARPGIHSKGGP